MNKTRKQRGGSLASLFKKKTPVSTTNNKTPLITASKNNTSVSYGRTAALNNWVAKKQKKAEAARMIRNHIRKLKGVNNATRNTALKMMNANMRNRTRKLLNYKNFNTLSNDQVFELYQLGKVRSTSL
jgi:hypothetical protein